MLGLTHPIGYVVSINPAEVGQHEDLPNERSNKAECLKTLQLQGSLIFCSIGSNAHKPQNESQKEQPIRDKRNEVPE